MDLSQPLAYRMMPKTLEDYIGQEDIIGENKVLYRTIKADRLSSIILWGPPGCGKTSLARVISETTKYKFYKINAVTSGVADIKKVVEVEHRLIAESKVLEKPKEKIKEGDIILSHNGTKHTADSLDMLIKKIKQKGLQVVKVSDLIYKDNYSINNNGTQIKNKDV